MKCGCTPELENRYKMKYYSQNFLATKSGKVKYIAQTSLDRLNPFLASIIGKTCLNLQTYNFTFNIFFATENTEQIDAYFTSLGSPVPTVIPFNEGQVNIITKAYQLTGDYLGVSINIAETIDDADYVNVNCEELDNPKTLAFTLDPESLDTNPESLQKFFIAFNESALASYNTEIGGIYFLTSLHEIGHTLGLCHPHDTSNGSKIMPGTTDATQATNQGLCFMNNTLTTIMSYVSPQLSDNPEPTTYSRTLMTLDLQAYRWYYKITTNTNYINNWLDLTCKNGVVQTLTSTDSGLELDLSPQEETDTEFNFVALKFIANPMQNFVNVYDLISTSVLSYEPNDAKYAASVFDTSSHASIIKVSYNTFNCYAWNIWKNFIINIQPGLTNLNIWLQGFSSGYNVERLPVITTITNINNNNKITIVNINDSINLFVGYALNYQQ